jgi:hypothetical protein
VAARIGSLAQLFKTHPTWLYEPDNPASLAAAIRCRMEDTAANYDPVPAWQDQAAKLKGWMARVLK